MNATYLLEHPDRDGQVSLGADGETVRIERPSESARELEMDDPNRAVDTVTDQLLDLTEDGWNIVDIQNQTMGDVGEVRTQDELPDGAPFSPQNVLDRVGSYNGRWLTLQADQVWVSVEKAQAILATVSEYAVTDLRICNGCFVENDGETSTGYTTVEPWCAALGRIGSDALTRFVVDTPYLGAVQAGTRCGNLDAVFERCPNLEQVFVYGDARIGRLAHSQLEHLALKAEGLDAETVAVVASTGSPRLKRLDLELTSEGAPDDGAEEMLLEHLSEDPPPNLEELFVGAPSRPVSMLRRLATSGIADQLDVLAVDPKHFDDADAAFEVMVDHADTFAQLDELYVDLTVDYVGFDQEQVDELRERIPGIRDVDDHSAFQPSTYELSGFKSG